MVKQSDRPIQKRATVAPRLAQGKSKEKHLWQRDESLLTRAERGDAKALSALAAQSADFNCPCSADGSTLVHLAARHGRTDIVRMLLTNPVVNPDISRKDGVTPLYLAAQNGHEDVVHMLLSHPATNPNQSATDGTSPLYIAAQFGLARVVRLLLAHQDIEVNTSRADGITPLLIASAKGYLDIVTALVEIAELNPNQCLMGVSALYLAAQNNHPRVVRVLLSRPDTDPNIQRSNGDAALHVAARCGHNEVVRAILSNVRTDALLQDGDGMSALELAIEHDHVVMANGLQRLQSNDAQPLRAH
jgi:ankyrin repeat protein